MPCQVFRRGQWISVPDLPFSDPMLTPALQQYAAAVYATVICKQGATSEAAERAAEEALYARLYGGGGASAPSNRVTRKQHNTP